MQNYTGADLILDILEKNGLKKIFGYPGGANIPFYDALVKHKNIKHYLVRHEQCAAFAAGGVSRSKNELGVCVTTSGPGASNALTGIMDAFMDNIPLLFISGQVPHNMIGKNAFQELDAIGVTKPITKKNYLIENVDQIIDVFEEAIELSVSGKPGPVHIDVPKNIFSQITNIRYDKSNINRKIKYYYKFSDYELDEFFKLLYSSKKVVLISGHGIALGKGELVLNIFLKKTGIVATNTLLGKGTIDPFYKNYLGMLGMHGFYHANMAVGNADLIINIGARFDDRIVGTYDTFGKNAKIIHVDIEKNQIGKLVKTDLGIVCDCNSFLETLNKDKRLIKINNNEWLESIQNWKKLHEKSFYKKTGKLLSIKKVYENINIATKTNLSNFIFVCDVGQHQMWASQIINVSNSKSFLSSGGAGTMGFSLPSAIGVAISHPKKTIISLVGDGGVQMNIQELQTIVDYKLNIKIIILNNGYLGMVRQWQELFYNKNYSSTKISSPNFVLVGEAYGIKSFIAKKISEFNKYFDIVIKNRGPYLIECKVSKFDNVFPMVSPGTTLQDTLIN